MLKEEELQELAKERLDEARVLHANKKHDGAMYLAGYAIELALKLVILKDRLWGFPQEAEEFRLYEDSRTHDLSKLLAISGKIPLLEDKAFLHAWNAASTWQSEFRYRPIGSVSRDDSAKMLIAVDVILKILGIAI